mmetsp:Transcript_18999/g.52740  ORF Transcript_18999/g.52740 Transcript_18999/m.52740 type:complete len:339 (+) Transcript_18999:601-1617(+)
MARHWMHLPPPIRATGCWACAAIRARMTLVSPYRPSQLSTTPWQRAVPRLHRSCCRATTRRCEEDEATVHRAASGRQHQWASRSCSSRAGWQASRPHHPSVLAKWVGTTSPPSTRTSPLGTGSHAAGTAPCSGVPMLGLSSGWRIPRMSSSGAERPSRRWLWQGEVPWMMLLSRTSSPATCPPIGYTFLACTSRRGEPGWTANRLCSCTSTATADPCLTRSRLAEGLVGSLGPRSNPTSLFALDPHMSQCAHTSAPSLRAGRAASNPICLRCCVLLVCLACQSGGKRDCGEGTDGGRTTVCVPPPDPKLSTVSPTLGGKQFEVQQPKRFHTQQKGCLL